METITALHYKGKYDIIRNTSNRNLPGFLHWLSFAQ